MSSNKRQKVEAGQGTQLLSAAALRRRLLQRQESSAASAPSTPASQDREDTTPADNNDEGKPRTAEDVLLGAFGAATTEDDLYGPPDVLQQDPPSTRKLLQLSSFKPTKDNIQYRPDGVAVLTLSDAERLVILGSYGIRVEAGEAIISGASLHPSEAVQWVHAPHCHALPVLRCSEQSVIQLHPHPSAHGIRSLEKLSPIFGSLWNENATAKRQTWHILATSADGPKRAFLQELKSPAEWNKQIAEVARPGRKNNGPPPRLMVCGPKSSGKSTFARIVTNKLLTRRDHKTKGRVWPGVAVLDIDPGQPEFSPPGVISLVLLDQPTLAPPFCHPLLDRKALQRAHAIASTSPAADIEHYKACVAQLFQTYRATCAAYPLVINTPGWVQGSGLALLTDLIAEVGPTEIIYMSEDGPQDTVESLMSSAGPRVSFSTLPSQSSEYTSRTALQLRHMQAMSYMHVDGGGRDQRGELLQWNPAPLSSTPPTMVSYRPDGGGIVAILCYGYQPELELLAEAIDGTMVAIVAVEGTADDPSAVEKAVQRTPERLPYVHSAAPLRPDSSQCLGLALVRGVASRRQLLALSTPVPLDQLRAHPRLVLVAGKFDPPTWAYTEDHYHRASHGGEDDAQDDEIPWVEKLHGSQKRAVGSKVWRVRRDLGRNNSASGD